MAFEDLVGANPELESAVTSRLSEADPRSALEQLRDNGFVRRFDTKADLATMILNPDSISTSLTYPSLRMEPQSLMYFRTEQIFVYLDSWILIMQPNTSWQAGRLE